MKLGNKLKKLRLGLKLSQFELAKKCGWGDIKLSKNGAKYCNGQIRISSYECNDHEPSINDLIILAKALNTSVSNLIEKK